MRRGGRETLTLTGHSADMGRPVRGKSLAGAQAAPLRHEHTRIGGSGRGEATPLRPICVPDLLY
jgi:hypothetical protein